MIDLRDFKFQMERLANRFDPKYYDPDLCMLIYRECQTLDIFWLKKMVTIFVGHHKPALLDEFREAIRLEKNRCRLNNSQSNDHRYANQSMFTNSQREFLFDLTRKVSAGTLNGQKQFLEIFLPALEKVIETKDQKTADVIFMEASESVSISYDEDEGPGAA